jgi:hypothetical protein
MQIPTKSGRRFAPPLTADRRPLTADRRPLTADRILPENGQLHAECYTLHIINMLHFNILRILA